MVGQSGGRSAATRQDLVRERVLRDGSVAVDDLVALTGVSRMTIHRDLDVLEAEGVLRKVRGGATATRSSIFESDAAYRLVHQSGEKAAIGRAAAALIDVGQAVIFDESTTSLAALKALDPTEPVTVITNCVPAMEFTRSSTRHQLIGLGGDYVPRYRAYLGILCEQMVGNVYADVLVSSCSATRGSATFHQDSRIVGVKRAMLKAAPMRLLLIDHSKIDMGALYHLGSLADFTHVITDDRAPEAFREAVQESGAQLVVAKAD